MALLERRLLSCFMTGAAGRYSASPASPQQSITPLSADERTPLILLLPLTLSETFKAFPRWLALTRAKMYAHILKTLRRSSHEPRETSKTVYVSVSRCENEWQSERVPQFWCWCICKWLKALVVKLLRYDVKCVVNWMGTRTQLMILSAHFIRLLACNIASYNSPAPLLLNSACRFDSVLRACVCMSDQNVYCFVAPLQFNRHSGTHGALMLRQHEVMTQ